MSGGRGEFNSCGGPENGEGEVCISYLSDMGVPFLHPDPYFDRLLHQTGGDDNGVYLPRCGRSYVPRRHDDSIYENPYQSTTSASNWKGEGERCRERLGFCGNWRSGRSNLSSRSLPGYCESVELSSKEI